ncbi:MAG: aconitate hydratase AcnA [Actinomycetota bacterium]|nr:aconitate hydratase AcnA [Actinomycetota bacterium]
MAHSRRPDPFGAAREMETSSGDVQIFSLEAVEGLTAAGLSKLPVTIRILLENLLRTAGTKFATEEDVRSLAGWAPEQSERREFPYSPARVILQDFTGVPAVVDLAAMRSAIARAGGNPRRVDPLVPVDLVIDHSVQVDAFGSGSAFKVNVDREYERNHERYSLLRWAQQSFGDFRVVPPGMGIVHQVNLEYLASVVRILEEDGSRLALPDTLVGTDSHTTMINGLGVLGWGVGGIEAEAALLGQPMPLATPIVVGFRMSGDLKLGVTATDLVLTITEILRRHGVVGKFIEFYGEGLSNLTVADRATISNMCPEYGATAALFPVDEQSLRYLQLTGRPSDQIDLVERYTKEQGIFRTDEIEDPNFSEGLDLDLSTVEPSLAGPRRPQDRVALSDAWSSFSDVYGEGKSVEVPGEGSGFELRDGSVVIAAITSCTNTSNPSVMLGAALLAKNAVERGLTSKPWVKTSMAPGSRVVTKYLEGADLIPYLEKLGFHVVGYGCTTCIGNSGPLPEEISQAVDDNDLAVVSVLSGNRNFEGRIHPQVKASYLASPPLVVAYALAGTVDIDLTSDPLGTDEAGSDVYLADIWPTAEAITGAMESVRSDLFHEEYAKIFEGEENWARLPTPEGDLYEWDPASTYVREPPFFQDLAADPDARSDIKGARVLVMVEDSVTTDHISPAGSIALKSPAGRYLTDKGVGPRDFNSYGSRRGNHEVMVRGTFANIRLRNLLAGKEGGWTTYFPTREETTIFDAAERYAADGTPLLILAGKEYGSGSSRDWAAKGPLLLGVKAVIAESYERIHRSNLVGMGILPLQFKQDENAKSLGLTGEETYDVVVPADGLSAGCEIEIGARGKGENKRFTVKCRIDSQVELDYYGNDGVLQMVLRRMLQES